MELCFAAEVELRSDILHCRPLFRCGNSAPHCLRNVKIALLGFHKGAHGQGYGYMTLCTTIVSLLLLQDAVKLGEKKIQGPPAPVPSSGTTTSVRVADRGGGREKKCCQSCMSWCQQCCGALIVSHLASYTSELMSIITKVPQLISKVVSDWSK